RHARRSAWHRVRHPGGRGQGVSPPPPQCQGSERHRPRPHLHRAGRRRRRAAAARGRRVARPARPGRRRRRQTGRPHPDRRPPHPTYKFLPLLYETESYNEFPMTEPSNQDSRQTTRKPGTNRVAATICIWGLAAGFAGLVWLTTLHPFIGLPLTHPINLTLLA